jgi:DNA-binding MarR family transcriptional regulator
MTTDLGALGLLLKRAQHRNHRTMDAALRGVGVTLVQWDALRAIARMPEATGHDLAVATFQSDQAFGTLATRLVERGLIQRSAGRGRRLVHTLTSTGRAALAGGQEVAADVLEDLFAPLDEERRRSLMQALRALTAGVPDPGPDDRALAGGGVGVDVV